MDEQIKRMKYQRDRHLTIGVLNRVRAGRWWQLGEALRALKRQPWRLDILARALAISISRQRIPPMPDVSGIDNRISELTDKFNALAVQQATESDFARRALGRQLVSRARLLYRQGEYEAALGCLQELPVPERSGPTAMRLARDCYVRLGELTKALASAKLAMSADPSASAERSARRLSGRLRETDPAWLPDAGQPSRSYEPANPRRILHVVKESLPYFQRGYTLRSHSTFMAQQKAGYQPFVVTSLGFPRSQGFPEFSKVELVDGVPHYRLDLGAEYRTDEIPEDFQLSDHATLTRILAEEVRPALIQAGSGYRGYDTALVGLSVSRALGIPFIYEVRSFLEQTWTGAISRSEHGEYYRRRREQETRCMLAADHVYTIADAMRDEIIARGVPADKVSVVPNVVDVQRFRPRARDSELKRTIGLDGLFILGYVSNLGKREGIDNLIEAVAILRESGYNVGGLVVGEGPERSALEDAVARLGLKDVVALVGHVDNREIERYYSLIDLFVVPRINDLASRLVVPLKPLEAMAMQLPIVASDLPALRELLGVGERGRLFSPGDAEALSKVASSLMSNALDRAQIAQAGRKWVQAERTVEANARRYAASLRVLTGV